MADYMVVLPRVSIVDGQEFDDPDGDYVSYDNAQDGMAKVAEIERQKWLAQNTCAWPNPCPNGNECPQCRQMALTYGLELNRNITTNEAVAQGKMDAATFAYTSLAEELEKLFDRELHATWRTCELLPHRCKTASMVIARIKSRKVAIEVHRDAIEAAIWKDESRYDTSTLCSKCLHPRHDMARCVHPASSFEDSECGCLA